MHLSKKISGVHACKGEMEEVSENCWLWKTPFWNEPVLFVSSKCLEKGKWFLSMAWHSFSSRMHSFWMVESFRESRNFRKNHNLCILLVNKLAQVPMPKHSSANIAQMKRYRCYWNFHLGIKSFFSFFTHQSTNLKLCYRDSCTSNIYSAFLHANPKGLMFLFPYEACFPRIPFSEFLLECS